MEKVKPHYLLAEIKAAVAARGKAAFTRTALFNSLVMGLTGDEAAYSTESDHRFHGIPITHSIESVQDVGA